MPLGVRLGPEYQSLGLAEQPPAAVARWTILHAAAGIESRFTAVPGGYQVVLTDGGKTLVLEKR